MARTPQEVFAHHAEVLIAGDLEGIVEDYADDAVFITPNGALHGKDGVREGLHQAAGRTSRTPTGPSRRRSSRATCCSSSGARRPPSTFVEDGIDTFVFRDGEITVQTVRYTLQNS